MKKIEDLEAQKDELKVRQAQEKANLNNKIRAEKNRQKREKEYRKRHEDTAYTDFWTKTEEMSLRDLLKELKNIIEENENDNTK